MSNKIQKSIINLTDKTIIEVFRNHILRYGGFKLVGFGIFSLKKMKGRKGFNPYTKKKQTFPDYVKISFSPTKQLKEEIQKWR